MEKKKVASARNSMKANEYIVRGGYDEGRRMKKRVSITTFGIQTAIVSGSIRLWIRLGLEMLGCLGVS